MISAPCATPFIIEVGVDLIIAYAEKKVHEKKLNKEALKKETKRLQNRIRDVTLVK